jgi:hypothetical protein
VSRGLGRIQRAVLDHLVSLGENEDGIPRKAPVYQIAVAVFQTDQPTDAQVSSVRRAVRTLANSRKVVTDRDLRYPFEDPHSRTYERRSKPFKHRGQWWRYQQTVPISETWVWLPPNLTPEQEEAAAKRFEELVNRWRGLDDDTGWIEMSWMRVADIPEPEYPPFIIDGLIHEGPTVMYGRPEAGKTAASLSATAAMMAGTSWLSRKVRESRHVAFWGLDPMQQREVKRRASHMPVLSKMLFSATPPGEGEAAWTQHGAELARLGADYVILDNLTRLMPRGKSVRDDDAVGTVLADIDILVNRFGIGVMLIHHAGKPGEDGNPKTTPLGATAIEAWGRHFLRVEALKDKAGEIHRTIVAYGNDLEVAEFRVPFVIGNSGVSIDECRDFDTVANRIQEIIDGQPWKSQTQIAEALGTSQPVISRTLKKAGYTLKAGRLVAALFVYSPP